MKLKMIFMYSDSKRGNEKNLIKGTSINSNNNLTARFAKKSQCSQCADF